MGITRWNERAQAARDRIEHTGVAARATIIGVPDDGAPGGSVCLTYTVTAIYLVNECIEVESDPGAPSWPG